MDEDFCSVLVPKLLESLCRVGMDAGTVQSIMKFLAIATKMSIECKKRMSAWLIQFIPNIAAEHRPTLILALPTILANKIEGVLEDALVKNVRDGRKDLAEASFSCLLRCKSSQLAEFIEEFDGEDSFEAFLSKFSLTELIEASQAFPHIASLKAYIRAVIADELERGTLDISSLSRFEFTPNGQELGLTDLLLLLVACSKSDSITLHRQFHRACLASPALTGRLLQKLPPNCEFLSSPLLELFSQFLECTNNVSNVNNDENGPSHSAILVAFAKRFINSGKEKPFLNLLASNILSGSEGSGVRSLQLLQKIVQLSPSSRWSCLGVIKALLDGLESMPPLKLNLFYSVFAFLARDSDTVANELLLLLKKQLYSFDPVYKRIGARGVVIFCSVLGGAQSRLLPDPDDVDLMDENGIPSDDECIAGCSQMINPITNHSNTRARTNAKVPLPAYFARLLISLLEEAVKSLRQDDIAFALLLDGLADLLSQGEDVIDSGIVEWIAEWITAFFKEEFIKENSEDNQDVPSNTDDSIDTDSLQFDCDDGENVLFLDLTGKFSSLAPLAFRLLARAESILSAGSLDSIDALHGCPIRLLDPEERGLLDGSVLLARRYACLCLMREIVATFAQTDREKNMKRLAFVSQLDLCLANMMNGRSAYMDEVRLFCNGRFLSFVSSDAFMAKDVSGLSEEITNELILQCLTEVNSASRKFTPLKRKSDEGAQLTMKSAREAFPLPLTLLQAALLHVTGPVLSFCLVEGRGLFEASFLIDLWRMKGPCLELLNQLTTATDLTESEQESIRQLSHEAWNNSTCESSLKIPLFKLFRMYDPENFSESPADLILNSNDKEVGELIGMLSARECLQLTQTMFPFEGKRGSLSVFKLLLGRVSQLLSVADFNSIETPLTSLTHLLQFSRMDGTSAWLSAVVKGVRPALQGLLKNTCPFFSQLEGEGVLVQAEERNRALALLRQLQQCTRSLQVICSHLKYTHVAGSKKRSASGSAIPLLRKALEALILRVGQAVARCGCSEAFWVGNLKHRDLEGAELSSQVALMDLGVDESDEVETDDDGDLDGLGNAALSKELISDSESESTEDPYVESDIDNTAE